MVEESRIPTKIPATRRYGARIERSSSIPSGESGSGGLDDLGWSDRWVPYLAEYEGVPGRILRHDGSAVLVGTDTDVVHIRPRPSTPPLAVGDWIVVDGETVEGLLPRASLLQRRDPSSGDAQPIAANVDIVGIVCGLDRPVNRGRVQRFTSLAWDAGATPLVILSKADLVGETADVEGDLRSWDPALDVMVLSSQTHIGVAELLRRCVDSTLVLVGESGAGKSTLLNALAGRELSATADVRRGDHKGRHTTTARQLHLLEGRVRLIDTPGVREVGLHTGVATVEEGFTDIAELAVDCRFRDCDHGGEPGCAVLDAVADGRLAEARLLSWRELRKEAAAAELRADPAARRAADRRFGRIYREAQKLRRDRR